MVHVVFKNTVIANPHEELEIRFDVHGLCVQLDALQHILTPIHYLNFQTPSPVTVIKHFQFLNKHFNLNALSASGLASLKECRGTYIAVADGGYFVNLTVLPRDMVSPKSPNLSRFPV